MENNGKKLGILSIVFCETTLLGLIFGIIGLIKGIKTNSKDSIVLNSIGIGLSVVVAVIIIVMFTTFINAFFGTMNQFI